MIIFLGPLFLILLIYVVAAVLPTFLLMHYADQQPSIHKQPSGMLMVLFGAGVLSALVSLVVEQTASLLTAGIAVSTFYKYLWVGIVEEGAKLFFLAKTTWKSPYFETRYDAIIYAVFVSLGFAAFENLKYVFSLGLTVALARAVLSIPAHMAFAVLMGIFYGRAKSASYSSRPLSYTFAALCYVTPVLLHCAYDTAASIPTVLFIVIVIIVYLIIFKLLKREALMDRFV